MAESHHPSKTEQHRSSKLEKEFELERMVLFSDAVFAIAITLMVIDIKWPEIPETLRGVNLFKLFQPTIFQFVVFTLSFFYIGRSWTLHLKLFRLLKTYDQGLISRNLLFLFFIVTFPFTASGIFGHLKNGFIFPLFLYIFNVAAVSVSHFLITRYIFYKKPGLSVPGEDAEKKYIYIRGMNIAIGMTTVFFILVLITIFFPGDDNYLVFACLLFPLLIHYSNKRARKYKPVS
jgi:uncharacterized membrane protein